MHYFAQSKCFESQLYEVISSQPYLCRYYEHARNSQSKRVREKALGFEVRAGPARLDDSLDDILRVIPILIIELDEVNAEVSRDVS